MINIKNKGLFDSRADWVTNKRCAFKNAFYQTNIELFYWEQDFCRASAGMNPIDPPRNTMRINFAGTST
jgi:hypothetical protein